MLSDSFALIFDTTIYISKILFPGMSSGSVKIKFVSMETVHNYVARCTGIYIGALIMSFITTFIRKIETPDIRLGGSTVLLMFLDIICYNIGIYNYNVWIASSTGLFFGFSSFFIY